MAVATAMLLPSGCTADPTDTSGGGPSGPAKVTYLTGFGASAHDAFIYVADEKGYFDEAGIDLDIQLGAGTQNLPALLADRAQFTYVDLLGLLQNIGAGTVGKGDFRTIAAVHQSTLTAIMAPEDSGISSPQDLTGKRIGAFTGSPTEFLLPAYAKLAGWTYDKNLVVPVQAQELFGLLPAGKADALSTFIIQQGVVEQAAGKKMRVWPFNQLIHDLLGTGLVATSKLVDENPDQVTKFRDAALRGLQYTLDNPDEAISILSARNPGAVPAPPAFVAQIKQMAPYVTEAGADKIGVLDTSRVERCIGVLVGSGVIPSGITPDAILGKGSLLAK